MNDSLTMRIRQYHNTAEHNERLYSEFTSLTDSISWLKTHRDLIEQNGWGYGDRAFHYMWYLLLLDLAQERRLINCLEIGIFKGQIISLWSKIAKEMHIDLSITGISPFEGNVNITSRYWRRFRSIFDVNYRKMSRVGNLHPKADYLSIIKEVYSTFDVDLDGVNLIKGFSNESEVIGRVEKTEFDLIYIDGDHSYEGARFDILTYAPLIRDGGYLVMDDAAFFLPGNSYWKGFESVSRAVEEIPGLGFMNVLNVGHNRIYKKTDNKLDV
jgi:hypothetical protein